MKIFNWHDNIKRRMNYRPYYRGTWEPLLMDSRHMLPFQFYDESSPSLFHVSSAGAATDITSYLTLSNHSNYKSYNGAILTTALPLGRGYFLSQGTRNYWTDDCDIISGSDYVTTPSDYISAAVLNLSEDVIGIRVESNVDFGGTYYRGGWSQHVWKRANIARSPLPKIIVTGDEKDGRLVKESIITATKFTISMKVNENEFEGFLEALPGIWTCYDKTGRTYNMNNIEISDPDWQQGNGICKIIFEDNISKFSYNNSNL